MYWYHSYYPNGRNHIQELRYSANGKRTISDNFNIYINDPETVHHVDESSVVVYDLNSNVIKTLFYDDEGALSIEMNYVNGKLHNDYGPAFVIYYDSRDLTSIGYYVSGKLHNELGPAKIMWMYDDIHIVEYQYHGKLHNLHGPAYIVYRFFGYYINDNYVIDYISFNVNGTLYRLCDPSILSKYNDHVIEMMIKYNPEL